MTLSNPPPSSPIAAVGVVISALAIASLARLRPPEAPPASLAVLTSTQARCVDINRAAAEELETLPRVGPGLAGRIIADRAAHGAFETPEALDRVRGIGPSTLRALRPHLCELRVPSAWVGLPDAGSSR